MKAVGMFASGISAYDSGKYTRKVMNTNAQNAQNAGVSERDKIRGDARMAMGQQLVDQGGSGFNPGTGTALDALHASALARELDFANSRAKANASAAEFKQKGQIAYAQGKAAMAGGIISGAAEIASEVAGAFGGAGGAGGEAGAGAGGGADMAALNSSIGFDPWGNG
jgi:hypothetical protein